MAKNQKVNHSELSNEDLMDHLKTETERLRKLKFSHAVSPIENPSQIKISRREIARLKTEQTKRKKQAKA